MAPSRKVIQELNDYERGNLTELMLMRVDLRM